ncbi:MAG TPA: tRNA (adenosine(37)-N6)-threonylcarbamoyltransferase complex transferase subunit TsaD [Candidatus Kerfeldbacteria bacterium]|nr:MAG: putative tRNA threonylcarbamoyladenosine biosynthesis protein Gcp [Parcubacteria group bacterium GW2011_GWA2_48_9]KKW16685.1 MAG: putative tRNA threonylcarbamoyladenosine biosynthesis protein Gcp [Parcubacteria group bacterium GW2011_GWC2_49_9]HCM67695.1 tRNA (adenosine(37)-N6)-threonylcarbamoyltransferase complex transferase subunit TsaD [Candidatus Kerfeldbacteria bacterium]
MRILSIETSCDETAISVVDALRGKFVVRSHIISSQIPKHVKYGGVVPEVAAREHVKNIIPTLYYALKKSKTKPKQIDLIAVTRGPGLMTSLAVGIQTAVGLAFGWKKPLVGVNHMEGHIYSNWVEHPTTKFPALHLVVSGGHTELVLMTGHGKYRLLGKTRDDAAGEAFDKVAKILNLPYPGGPSIQRAAEKGNPQAVDFPRPMMNAQGFEFSFAGLKTSVLYHVQKMKRVTPRQRADIAASFQQAVVDVLVAKTVRAATQYRVKSVFLAGGVAANKPLREQLAKAIKKELPRALFTIPPFKLCTDNATMIAVAGYFRYRRNGADNWQTLDADPNWELV